MARDGSSAGVDMVTWGPSAAPDTHPHPHPHAPTPTPIPTPTPTLTPKPTPTLTPTPPPTPMPTPTPTLTPTPTPPLTPIPTPTPCIPLMAVDRRRSVAGMDRNKCCPEERGARRCLLLVVLAAAETTTLGGAALARRGTRLLPRAGALAGAGARDPLPTPAVALGSTAVRRACCLAAPSATAARRIASCS
jgi:hypothetical protein